MKATEKTSKLLAKEVAMFRELKRCGSAGCAKCARTYWDVAVSVRPELKPFKAEFMAAVTGEVAK